MRVSIIGTAGRRDDAAKLTLESYSLMFQNVLRASYMANPEKVTLVSGGAAWADHLAVSMYLAMLDRPSGGPKLELYLPCSGITPEGFTGNEDANTANYYHKRFSKTLGKPGQSIKTIHSLLEDPNVKIHYGEGFKARNLEVGKSDVIHAFTFGVHSYAGAYCSSKDAGLKDGGTAHTWNNANKQAHFIHTNITHLINRHL